MLHSSYFKSKQLDIYKVTACSAYENVDPILDWFCDTFLKSIELVTFKIRACTAFEYELVTFKVTRRYLCNVF